MNLYGKNYYALLCHSGATKDDAIICGVYATKKEAEEVYGEIKDCVCKHTIKRCSVNIVTH